MMIVPIGFISIHIYINNDFFFVYFQSEIEQALIEGEHELVFKQILDASESDQQKIRQLYKNLQVLIERIMTEKNSVRKKIFFLVFYKFSII